MKRICMVLFGLAIVRLTGSIVTREITRFDIYPSSTTITYRETTAPIEPTVEENTFRYYKQIYQGSIILDKTIEATYTPGDVTDPIIDFGNE